MTDDTENHTADALAYALADEETQLRIRLSDLRRRYQDQAQPIIERLAKLEAMKPAKPMLVYADLIPALASKGYVLKVMQDLAAMIDDAKSEVDKATGIGPRLLAGMADVNKRQKAVSQASEDFLNAAINGHAITRTWTDEEGKLTSERIAPEDFYAKPEGAGDD